MGIARESVSTAVQISESGWTPRQVMKIANRFLSTYSLMALRTWATSVFGELSVWWGGGGGLLPESFLDEP